MRFGKVGTALLVAALAVMSFGCPGGGGNGDAGIPPDACNTKEEAVSNTDCHLEVNSATPKSSYLSEVGDQDWYSIVLPATVNGRSLLQVTAGYGGAPGTPVDFSATVLRGDGTSALANGVDRPVGVPHYVTLVLTLDASYANQTLLLLVKDDLNTQRDVRSPYNIQITLVDNPDTNEPNDVTPTPITVSGGQGTAIGYLATPNDVDQFTFPVPDGRKIAYVRVTAATLSPPGPPQLATSYELYNPAGTRISEGRALPLTPVDIATARLSNPTGGTYRLVVRGYKATPNANVPGDVRFRYDVLVRTLDDVDPHEGSGGNDTLAVVTGSPVTLNVGGTVNRTPRISYVNDADWIALNLPAGTTSTLRYRVTPSGTPGRFPPLPGPVDRQLRIFTPFGGSQADCLLDTLCPKDRGNAAEVDTAISFCGTSASLPRMCMRSQRNEFLTFTDLRNFEGVIPVPPAGGTYYFVFQDEGTNWADDSTYNLTLTRTADNDENTRAGLPSQTETVSIASDMGSYSPDPVGANLTGTLTYGHGYFFNNEPTVGEGVRAPRDYDAEVTDEDRFQVDFPVGANSRAWALSWEVQTAPGGVPSELFVSAEFCTGSPGSCTPVDNSGQGYSLFYNPQPLASWHLRDAGTPNLVMFSETGTNPRITRTLATGCFCLEPRFSQNGRLFLTVSAVDRQTHEPVQYTVRTGLAPYPQSYSDGTNTVSCPPDPTPGCQFTSQ